MIAGATLTAGLLLLFVAAPLAAWTISRDPDRHRPAPPRPAVAPVFSLERGEHTDPLTELRRQLAAARSLRERLDLTALVRATERGEPFVARHRLPRSRPARHG